MSIGGSSRRSGDREGLIRAYDEEEAAGFGLTDLAEDTDEDDDPRSPMIPSFPGNGNGNGNGHGHRPNGHLSAKNEAIELQQQKRRSGER